MASGRGRHVEVRGDVESRPALERQLLDAIAGPLDDARHARVERISLERSAEHPPDFLDHRFLPVQDFLPLGNRIDRLLASITRVVRDADQVLFEIVGIIGQRDVVDAQLHARRAGEAVYWRGRPGTTDRSADTRHSDGSSGGLEEGAARVPHMVCRAILVPETRWVRSRVSAWSVRTRSRVIADYSSSTDAPRGSYVPSSDGS
jgi:hypothetical protein